jgi:GTPase
LRPASTISDASAQQRTLPTIVIVGRPNVGKSTLFNRLVGSRRAIVGDEPGITRDRLYGIAEWRGKKLRIVDTGGMVPGDKESILTEIFEQAQFALAEAAVIVLVVDGRTELASPDMELARLLRRSGKPVLLAVNKIDDPKMYAGAENFRRLGIGELVPVSAEGGDGVAELLDAALAALPEKLPHMGEADAESAAAPSVSPRQAAPAAPGRRKNKKIEKDGKEQTEGLHENDQTGRLLEDAAALGRPLRVAIIGRPNVGKSTLLNRLTGTPRAIVSPVPGTTRDAVDELVEHNGHSYRLVDTAGIRRKGKTKLMAEKLSVVMARKHLEAADVALLLIDAVEGVTAVDAHIAGYAHESGRSLIIVVNKWDLLTGATREGKPATDRPAYEQRVRDALKFIPYAPVLFISASQGKGTDKIFPTLEKVSAERSKRVGTGEMNRFLERVDFGRAAVPAARQVKIYYMTQASTSPPTFVLFTDRNVKLHFSYERFLENQIRKAFGFIGTPIRIKVRGRE